MAASTIWAAYAAAIATLAGPGGLGLTNLQRFAINKQNDFSIPVVPYANQLYQNWNVYQFASTVPKKDVAVLVDSGQNYDTAYGVYLDNVFLQVPNDPRGKAQMEAWAAKLSALRISIQTSKAAAKKDFATDCPNGIDPFTNKPTTLGEYAAIYYPEIADNMKEIATIEAVRAEFEAENSGGAQLARLNTWRGALAKGTNQSSGFVNYNMPVLQAEEDVIVEVVNGTLMANNQPTSFEASYSIGGSFNKIAKNWIDTFPKEYPYDRKRYDQGKSTYSVKTIDITKNNWAQYGYGSKTQSTGSDGWIFWSTKNTQTNTWSYKNVYVNETSFISGITVSAWGIGKFPIQKGQWYQGNPLATFPVLVDSGEMSKKNITDHVSEQVTSVVMGYGVETTFQLEKTAYERLAGAISTAKSSGGSISIFGSLYGKSDGSYSSTYEPWDNIKQHKEGNTITLLAHNNKVPMILGATITTITP
ncbi:hypothetical protein QBC46DRAFT_459560 [Diplogelasinospora grovesii]|uniref:Uncharacterized protein n=1 Tax=Diplogelasinospora grovesii TaxID=303347 RepID=A0AAN6S3E6_9PEZI|nr:hypothetical protein QBC46DRAFT_459560 [Diplogelasinospora grovesii]